MSDLKYRILDIDLTSQSYYEYDLPNEIRDKYLGGAGVNARILLDELDSDVDPLSPDNILIFGAGAVVGTRFPCSGRFTVTTKSPLTNIYADSNAGGFFGMRMCQAGYNHIIIRGKSETPTYILIEANDKISFLSADEVWGKDIFETDKILLEKHGNCETARIGPAGENQVLYANIASSRTRLSFNGRTGTGAVMGSKNLKAIVIKTEGLKAKNIENPEFNELAELYKSTIKNSSGCKYRASTGTLNIMTAFNVCEDIWERNYQEFVPEQKAKKLEPENFLENYYTERKSGCWNCSMACSLHWEIKEGEYTGLKGEKIEFGHTFPLGVNLGCFNFDEVLYLADLSNKLGLDSMELGFSLGFLTECVQRNIVKEEDVGLKVEWGNSRVYGELIKMIADRKGIGEILSHGVRQASMAFGEESRKFAFHYKGQAYRMESNRSWELSFAVSPRGGDHLKAMPFTTFAFGTPHSMDYMLGKSQMDFYDMQSEIGKGRYTWWHENYKTIVDCLGICIFPLINLFLNGEAQPADLLKVYNTCTGSNLSLDEFWLSAERVYQIMRLFNTFQGIDRKDDILPDRKTDDEEKCFPINSININASGMLDEYYTYRGYSSQGLPTYKRLKEVGLEEIIPRLEKADLIGNDDVPEALELFNKK